ncbi:MAG: hypothetical protein ABH805_02160 [Candidatus Nealsonbacteria bacterium]
MRNTFKHVKGGKPLFFNSQSDHKRYLTLQEIKEIASQVFGKEPEEVQFFSQSKFGLCSYKIFYPGSDHEVIKCRECFSEDSAKNIEELTANLNKNGIRIVSVLGRYKHLLFLKWINGESVKLSDFLKKPDFLEKLVKYQVAIHSCSLSERFFNKGTESPYFDFLKKRFVFFASKYIKLLEIQNIVEAIEKMTPTSDLSVTYPDFTIENIILENGEPILIDSETLNVDTDYEYDIMNAQKSFFPHSKALQNYYLSLYKKYRSVRTLESNHDYWELVYLLRSAGSRFQEQDPQEGKKLMNTLQTKIKALREKRSLS